MVANDCMWATAASPASVSVQLPCRFRAVTPRRLFSASRPASRKGTWRHPSRLNDLRHPQKHYEISMI